MRNPCHNCPRHTADCRRGCTDNAVREILAVIYGKRDAGIDADGFLVDSQRKRSERWNIKQKGRR